MVHSLCPTCSLALLLHSKPTPKLTAELLARKGWCAYCRLSDIFQSFWQGQLPLKSLLFFFFSLSLSFSFSFSSLFTSLPFSLSISLSPFLSLPIPLFLYLSPLSLRTCFSTINEIILRYHMRDIKPTEMKHSLQVPHDLGHSFASDLLSSQYLLYFWHREL